MKKAMVIGVVALVVFSGLSLLLPQHIEQPIPPPFDPFLLGFQLEPITDKAFIDEVVKRKRTRRDLFESKLNNEAMPSSFGE